MHAYLASKHPLTFVTSLTVNIDQGENLSVKAHLNFASLLGKVSNLPKFSFLGLSNDLVLHRVVEFCVI